MIDNWKPKLLVGVAIVTYQSSTSIEHCLSIVTRSPVDRIAVVDNASSDETPSLVAGFSDERLVLKRLDQNIGFGAGMNRCLDLLDECDFILCLNPDASIEAHDLKVLTGYLESHPHCGLVGPRLYEGGAPVASCGPEPSIATELELFLPVLRRSRPR